MENIPSQFTRGKYYRNFSSITSDGNGDGNKNNSISMCHITKENIINDFKKNYNLTESGGSPQHIFLCYKNFFLKKNPKPSPFLSLKPNNHLFKSDHNNMQAPT
jgi:hypothetical protein